MTKRVVSKRTKLLFIGFGAAAIAAACIVAAAEMDRLDARARVSGLVARPVAAAKPVK